MNPESPLEKRRDDYLRLAGFFEGEGCITVGYQHKRGKRRSCRLRVSVSQNSRNDHYHKFLTLFKKYFGGTIITPKKLTKGRRRANSYRIADSGAVNLLKTLFPFLEEKRDRARLAIRFGGIKLKSNQYIGDPQKFRKQGLADEIKRLNHIK